MKKVILAVAVLFSVAMVSCGGDKKAADTAMDSAVEESVVTEVSESVEEVAAPAESAAAEVAPTADSAK